MINGGLTMTNETDMQTVGANAIQRRRRGVSEIRLTREEEREIDNNLGPRFKKKMNEFADKLADLMLEFPMAQGHCKQAQYLRQPFSMMSSAVHLVKRFGMSEEERDKDDELIAGIPAVLDALANGFEKEGGAK